MNKKTPYPAYYFATVEKVTSSQIKAMNQLSPVDISAAEQWMDKHNIYGIVQGYPGYHRRCEKCPSPPYILFGKGNLEVLNRPILAIVGPREMSAYAQHVLQGLFAELKHYDVITISGMAAGVDTMCHELSLQNNIPTVAVLGGGFHHFLRGTRRMLLERIVSEGGLVLSEYKHGFSPTARSFPQRNRLIAGLADRVFLPEAQEKSGSLITADIAHKHGIPVAAPLQHIFAASGAGTNRYITEGIITPVYDLAMYAEKHFARIHMSIVHTIPYTDEEQHIMDVINQYGEVTMEQLIARTSYTSADIFVHLSMLEMKGSVYESSPGIYTKKSLH